MDYIEGFVAPVPVANKQRYIEHARQAAELFKEHGALKLVECWGDDVPSGEKTSFPMAVQCKEDEVVVFSWVVWPSREVRDKGMQLIESDPRMADNPMPFDGSRLIYGGFQMVLES
jgi:uncharacterized protein YbaA (DUF1428 family)